MEAVKTGGPAWFRKLQQGEFRTDGRESIFTEFTGLYIPGACQSSTMLHGTLLKMKGAALWRGRATRQPRRRLHILDTKARQHLLGRASDVACALVRWS